MKKLIFLGLMALNCAVYSADINPYVYAKKKAKEIFEAAKKEIEIPEEIILEDRISIFDGFNYYYCPKYTPIWMIELFNEEFNEEDMCYHVFTENLAFMFPEKIFKKGYDCKTGKVSFVIYISANSLESFKEPIANVIHKYFINKTLDDNRKKYVMEAKIIPVKIIAEVSKKFLDRIAEIEKFKSTKTTIKAKL